MIIKKYQKLTNGRYKVYLDSKEVILYEDIIIKYNLLLKKELDEEFLNEILIDNEKQKNYSKCLKYITTKMRSKKEIIKYLEKNAATDSEIDSYIFKLESIGLINDIAYAKAYISDKLNLSSSGPYKIKKELLENNISESIIDELLDKSSEFIQEKLVKIIEKRIKLNSKRSFFLLKKKIINDLINLGYSKESIMSVLDNSTNNQDEELLINEYERISKKLCKKYSGDDLKYQIKQRLYKLGFPLDLINKTIYDIETEIY